MRWSMIFIVNSNIKHIQWDAIFAYNVRIYGLASFCFNWTEICDEKIVCINGGHDEEYFWQWEANECNENQNACANGQYIPATFFQGRPCYTSWPRWIWQNIE